MRDLINFMIQESGSAFKMNFPTFSNNGKNKKRKTHYVFPVLFVSPSMKQLFIDGGFTKIKDVIAVDVDAFNIIIVGIQVLRVTYEDCRRFVYKQLLSFYI
mgnify:CR=1 FL=1